MMRSSSLITRSRRICSALDVASGLTHSIVAAETTLKLVKWLYGLPRGTETHAAEGDVGLGRKST